MYLFRKTSPRLSSSVRIINQHFSGHFSQARPRYTTMSSSSTTPKPILISGAGIAALLFARSLHRQKIPFLVFERDASIVFRAQGYRLRLSAVGLDAIESALGPEDFEKFYDACGKTGGAGFAAIDPLTGETLGSGAPSVSKEPLTRWQSCRHQSWGHAQDLSGRAGK
jgi:hypothetical protein